MGFRDLQRYPQQKAKYDKYLQWLEATPAERQAKFAAITNEAQRVKIPRDSGYISPFGTAGSTKIYLPAPLIAAADPTGQGAAVAIILRGLLASYTTTETEFGALSSPVLIDAKKFKFAKLMLKAVVPGTTRVASRITGALYYKPAVDSVSAPFGQNTGGQEYTEAVDAIKGASAFTTFIAGNGGKNTYKFTPEG